MSPDQNGWNEYEKLVMDKLEGLETGQKEMRKDIGELRTDMAVQKVKAGLWGALAGTVPAGIMVAYHFFFAGKKS